MTKLLFDEEPLVVQPTLAKLIGLNNAIIVQQLHYWLRTSPNYRENKPWVYNTYADWAKQFKFWTPDGIKKMIRKLEDEGIIISSNFNAAGFDKTKWYTIDYERLDEVCKERIEEARQSDQHNDGVRDTRRSGTANTKDRQGQTSSNVDVGHDDGVQRTSPIPEITTEINHRKPPTTSAGDASLIWSRCLEHLTKKLSAPTFQSWFSQTKGYDYSDKTLTVVVPDDFTKDWIESRYATFVHDSLNELSKGQEIKVHYILREGGTGGYETGPLSI